MRGKNVNIIGDHASVDRSHTSYGAPSVLMLWIYFCSQFAVSTEQRAPHGNSINLNTWIFIETFSFNSVALCDDGDKENIAWHFQCYLDGIKCIFYWSFCLFLRKELSTVDRRVFFHFFWNRIHHEMEYWVVSADWEEHKQTNHEQSGATLHKISMTDIFRRIDIG